MFRFTIRELALLTLVVSMGVAWWVDRRRLSERISFLEWRSEVIYTEEGKFSVQTFKRVAEEDRLQAQRFANQSDPYVSPRRTASADKN